MNRLKRLAAVLLNPHDVDIDDASSALEAAGVPVSFADCRNCPNPCDQASHEDYPNKIVSMIDTKSDMLGSVKPYRRQVVISTGKSDWERSVTSVKDTLAAFITTVEGSAPTPGTSLPGTPQSGFKDDFEAPRPGVVGIFRDSETSKLSILNGSHDTLCTDHACETVLVFPDYKIVTEVPRSVGGAQALWDNSVNPTVPRMGSLSEGTSVKSWIIPYSCVILICSHRRRDVRCAVVAPKLEHAFSDCLCREGWDVHTQLDAPTGPPLEEFNDSEESKSAEMDRRLQELDSEDLSKRALILKTSHIGGHRYAGNVIIYMPQGAGVWYGRVSTHEVEPIVKTTILGGMILPPLLRGGVNLARPDCKKLTDW
ncbi:hypothetical protein FA95DRAFT_1482489 [Auriscalpium vulgare]|uniref:Uncharacterized protein n=1 Tax=Auriscalpium vulgare TaxID=40419 RepID=A0ACB8SAT8_9AGAM|nr:hypothetical protein FA95DRAFT_1482489 [Auriscalpium vulgare]